MQNLTNIDHFLAKSRVISLQPKGDQEVIINEPLAGGAAETTDLVKDNIPIIIIQPNGTVVSNEENSIAMNSFSAAVADLNLTGVSDLDFLMNESVLEPSCNETISAEIMTFPFDNNSSSIESYDPQSKQTVTTLQNNKSTDDKQAMAMNIDREDNDNNEEDISSEDQSSDRASTGLSKHKIKKPNKRLEKKKLKSSGVNKAVKPNPCAKKKCQNNCKSVSETDRKQIFNAYYELETYEEKKSWLIQCIKQKEIRRKRTKNNNSKRQKTI
ncbi:probable WRKY transcription factor protein 1 isoform X1 [Anthonomus grandis grandis]|uniref:probable WRKY transcription factor protein 1 isoform X1 n=2 Tax=Anthonomus grandis grandis TaxID=2921223 RepID=UPI0021665ADE|nr:probable WRKY transcription factor protein 1 isoform X1 [Anthonomus grandis grandis]XP_050295847.1 probable WRKY transcription factor protein 1 isoform X1 [Anthonomus grandis grandis]